MSENQNGQEENQNLSEEELNKDIEVKDLNAQEATPEDVEDLNTKSKTLLAQKKHWRNKAIDPETGKPYKDLYAELKKGQKEKEPQNKIIKEGTPADPDDEGDTSTRLKRLEQSEEKRQFGHENNLTPAETDHIFAYAHGAGIKPEEALEKDFIKNSLEAMRNEKKNESATPGTSSRSPKVEGKTFAQMNKDERKKNFAEVVKKTTGQE